MPPTIPTDNGNSRYPTRFPSSSFDHLLNDLYLPELAAYAFAAASIARLSCPVALATAIVPFIIPLL